MTAQRSYPRHGYTMADYRQIERETGRRFEFFQGEVYAMTGGSPEHARLIANLIVQLGRQLQGSSCTVFSSDLGVWLLETGLATYADVTVVCGPLRFDPEDENAVVNPIVLVEVTSPSSEKRDRGEKLEHYVTIPSLKMVVVVSHRERLVEVYHRSGIRLMLATYREGQVLLSAIACSLDVEELYRGSVS